MRVHIGSDHAAFELKEYLVEQLSALGYDVVDHGALTLDAQDDYPDFIIPAAEAVIAEPGSLGFMLGGSGNGECIAANKVDGVRCALGHSLETAKLAREHNDANCLALGGRMQPLADSLAMAKLFLETPFSGDERHARRIAKLTAYEQERDAE